MTKLFFVIRRGAQYCTLDSIGLTNCHINVNRHRLIGQKFSKRYLLWKRKSMLLAWKQTGQENKEGGQDGFYMRALARRCVWRGRWHRGADSSPDSGQAASPLQNSTDSESIKGRIMRANYVVRPFAGFWQRFAKILTACMFLFDRLPKPIQMLPKPERRAGNSEVSILTLQIIIAV